MKYYQISYASDDFKSQQEVISKIYEGLGFESIKYSPSDIPTEYYEKNRKILKEKRGAGYWLWKPFFILKTLEKMEAGDILVYNDCGDLVTNKILNFIKENINDDFLLIKHYVLNKQYVKGDCFHFMDCKDDIYFDSNHIEAGFCAFQKGVHSVRFVTEWLDYCQNYKIVSDSESQILPNHTDFIEHRHDQSVLSLLAIKYELKTVEIKKTEGYIQYNILDQKN